MTGKEHGLLRAVLFFSPQHSSTCQSLPSFFRKRKIEIMGVIWRRRRGRGVVVALKCQRQGSLTGLLSATEYQYGFILRFRCFLEVAIRCKLRLFKNLSKSEQREIWSFWELFMVWLVRAEREAAARGQLWSVLTPPIANKKQRKVKIKITESLPTPLGRLLSSVRTSSQMNGQLLFKIQRERRKEEEECQRAVFFSS